MREYVVTLQAQEIVSTDESNRPYRDPRLVLPSPPASRVREGVGADEFAIQEHAHRPCFK